jgi:SAM-dependent methyltransferase
MRRLNLRPGASILDFGCGTGLFASTLDRAGFTYCGYDPDDAAVRYASKLYPGLTFVSRLEQAIASAPYDVVLANCCFHHISDHDLLTTTLPAIARFMRPDSIFLLCDVLPLEREASAIRRMFNLFERGTCKRTAPELERLVAGRFAVRSRRVQRAFFFSAAVAANPAYNDLIQYELVLESPDR